MKYFIHECDLPTICRPPPGRYLLGRYAYTGLQHFLGQAQLLCAMCVEKRKMSNKYTYLTILSPPLPDSSANKSPTRPLQSTSIRIPTSSCTNTACSCEGIGVGDVAQWYGNIAALVFPRPPHAAAWVFSGTEAPG